jgi:hypothetical protein
MYRQFYNYDDVIFLYCYVSDSNYRLPIDTEIFLFEFIHFRWTKFYRPYFIFDFPVSVINRIIRAKMMRGFSRPFSPLVDSMSGNRIQCYIGVTTSVHSIFRIKLHQL